MLPITKYFQKKNISEFGEYDFLVIPGTNDELVVACAGVGNVHTDTIRFEFKPTLEQVAPHSHKIFIKDNSRSWYTQPDGRDKLVDYIQAYIFQNNISKSIVFGLSMGGYGALVLDSLIGFDRVVALSTRSGLGKHVPFDNRNKRFIKRLNLGIFDSLEKFQTHSDKIHLVFSIDDRNDVFHAYRASKLLTGINFHAVRGNHNIGYEYGRRGRMYELVSWILNGTASRLPYGFMSMPDDIVELCSGLLDSGYRIREDVNIGSMLATVDPESVPAFLFSDYVACRSINRPESNALEEYHESDIRPIFVAKNTYLNAKNAEKIFVFGWQIMQDGGLIGIGGWQVISGSLINFRSTKKYSFFFRCRLIAEKKTKANITFLNSDNDFEVQELNSQSSHKIIKITPLFSKNGDFSIVVNSNKIEEGGEKARLKVEGVYFEDY